MVKPDKATAME